jgi:hypothetical protein
MFNTRMKVKAGKKINQPFFALRYNLRVLSFTHSSQRDPMPSKSPLALDKIVLTRVDRTIAVAKRKSATSSEKEDTDKKEK